MNWKTIGIGICLFMGAVMATEIVLTIIGSNTAFPANITKSMSMAKNTEFYLCADGSNASSYCPFFNLTADSDGTNIKINSSWASNTGCRVRLRASNGDLLKDLSTNQSYQMPTYATGSTFGLEVTRTSTATAQCNFNITEG